VPSRESPCRDRGVTACPQTGKTASVSVLTVPFCPSARTLACRWSVPSSWTLRLFPSSDGTGGDGCVINALVHSPVPCLRQARRAFAFRLPAVSTCQGATSSRQSSHGFGFDSTRVNARRSPVDAMRSNGGRSPSAGTHARVWKPAVLMMARRTPVFTLYTRVRPSIMATASHGRSGARGAIHNDASRVALDWDAPQPRTLSI
jgi:hypothetical protein